METDTKKVDVVLGLQWGDEGKGKIVDVLAQNYPAVARFQGGPNAGHSLHFGGRNFVLGSVPSGIFRDGSVNIIGGGVVLDPVAFMKECESIAQTGVAVRERIVISKKAHLILPSHKLLDAANEAAAGGGKIGSTLKGIGPTYTDKAARRGLRVGEILAPDFAEKYARAKAANKARLEALHYGCDIDGEDEAFFEAVAYLKGFKFIDCEYFVEDWLRTKPLLAEGAQGSMLDIDHGSYPFVTSSSTTCGGVCLGLGVPPSKIGRVYGIFKAYCTRVGSGPFPTELSDATGERLRELGHEFGAVTGRPRRCGWLDLVALRYTVMLNGVTDLIIMKSDCLDGFDKIRVCTAYKVDGVETRQVPFDLSAGVEPVYEEFKGWNCDLSSCRSEESLPVEFRDYVRFIEEYTGVRVSIISVGPDRDATVWR